jgi:copper chaperone CopZ
MQTNSLQEQKVTELYVGGMACAFCASTIEKGLRHVNGVRSVKVLLESGEVFIRHNPSLVDKNRLKMQLQDLGYYVFEGKQNVSAQVLDDSGKRAIRTWILVGISFLLVSPIMFPYVLGPRSSLSPFTASLLLGLIF